jgi:uroporphyrinogen-III decarboxylase
MGPVNSVYFLMEHPKKAEHLLKIHETTQLNCILQCVENNVKVVMSMDNLDAMFHPPDYVRAYSESFYRKASSICHAHDALFFIHACGQQKANLKLISSYRVDGLEGVAFPPLGDVELDDAMRETDPEFIITGGISAMETRNLKTKREVFSYVENLFRKMAQYRNRFIFSSSCNTAIDASWETILWFRDAWMKYRNMDF